MELFPLPSPPSPLIGKLSFAQANMGDVVAAEQTMTMVAADADTIATQIALLEARFSHKNKDEALSVLDELARKVRALDLNQQHMAVYNVANEAGHLCVDLFHQLAKVWIAPEEVERASNELQLVLDAVATVADLRWRGAICRQVARTASMLGFNDVLDEAVDCVRDVHGQELRQKFEAGEDPLLVESLRCQIMVFLVSINADSAEEGMAVDSLSTERRDLCFRLIAETYALSGLAHEALDAIGRVRDPVAAANALLAVVPSLPEGNAADR